ncbi:signal transducing adapter molecule 2 [Anopheles bellator]|uniref:signal transducing adapter molecule 2 n=1 Tax=Anopheles bellator TaxID=139047 RepID=UPI0026490A62|nr:signal transducing adapter molecule 2 [Anopheles bellator]
MSLFGTSSSLNPDIEKATNENNTTEKWGLIMDICDKVNSGTATPKECLKSIIKRLNHANPHVVMKAITLLDACVNNCGKQFHLEVASREFETEFKKLLQKSQPKVTTKLKLSLKRWAEETFKSDPQLDLIPSLYKKLRDEGHDFSDPSATPKRETPLSKDPNVVSSQQEEDDIAKAIELSLKEVKISQSPKMSSTAASGPSITSLYPSTLLTAAPVPEPRKVRALYDFEAAEDNELTFQAGEIIMVLDDSDPNWWKGQNQRGEGLFPSNFVTADLSVEPESLGATGQAKGSKKSVQFSDDPKLSEDGTGSGNEKDTQLQKLPVVEINEEKINRLLHLIHEADPQDPSQDTEEMLQLEQLVNQMGPLIDAELERVDRKHAQLTQLSSDLVDAINLYHNLMREPDRSMMMSMGGGPAGGAYGMTGGPAVGAYPGAPMPPMYGMPGMYPPSLPGAGMYPMGPGHQQQQPPMSGYSMGQLRHDMGQMNVAPGMPQFPAPQQSSLPHLPHHHPVSSVSQNGPTNSMAPVATSMAPGVSSQPTTQPAPTPQSMPNMTVPQMTPQSLPPAQLGAGSHMQQAPIPQGYANPTSPPPTGMSGPGVPPTQLRPSGPLSYQNYGPQASPQQQQPQPQPVPQSGPPPQQQPQHVPVTGSGMGVSLPATTQPANMNHHPHLTLNGVASGGSGPAIGHYPPVPPTSGPGSMPPSQMPPHHQQHLHQQQPQQTFIMPPIGGPPQAMGGYPMGPMVGGGGMFPSGPVLTSSGPLSINTNPGPQNIPIYQQQR